MGRDKPNKPRRNPNEVIPPELDGAVIPGGCDVCDAEQRMTQISPGLWRLTVSHDNWCPVLAAYEGRSA
ncbi:hypothetical protein [Streptomyces massasporeus]|uniref:hypothetical protein n=1 Tax=Streptomyces massasporeus TaxID=67324 RepID=UPI00365A846A